MTRDREATTSQERSPGDRTRYRLLVAGVLLIILGQAAAIWPFDRITVYKSPPDDMLGVELNVVAITPDGEQDVVRTGRVHYRIVRLYRVAYKRAHNASERQEVLAQLCDYVARSNPASFQLHGVRLYNLTWDLDAGQIVGQEFVDEYLPGKAGS